ncbi:MAG TPA: LysR family transcriptional regulator [Thermoleophilaceae bacterium]|nr:LysR family transcriptional regulator [Thermoleophilaceae bacterium]
MAITLTQLRSFLAVLRTGSVTGAADALVVTQPSVSAALSALSRELGIELTERVGRSVRPSPAGRAFAPYAADVVGLLEQGSRAAREASDTTAREVRVSAVTTAGEHIVPPLMEAFAARHPDIALSVDVGNRERVFERIRSRASDIAIAGRPPRDGGIEGIPFIDNPVVLIAAPTDPLVRAGEVSVAELGTRPWLLREEGSGTRGMAEEFLARHDLHPEILTLGSNGAIKQTARAGLGISLQSLLATHLELELGLLATVETPARLPERHWYLLQPTRGPVRESVRRFAEFAPSREARRAVEDARLVWAPGAQGARTGGGPG